ncbi:vacuolar transporter chaperone [Orbilia ellipsospora]|uniref:Vacuolar transporter chaperone complex subunit 4 n=1 Tax=Orbilia ellipsospora TaxID=2528407 RepID=A0AAV9XGC1_9PEZI
MKFGQHLRTGLIKDYSDYYIDYDGLKAELKNRLFPPNTHYTQLNPKKWTEDDEAGFVAALEAELDKVYTFQKVKASEIVRRIKAAELEVESVIKLLERNTRRRASVAVGVPDTETESEPNDEEFELLEADLSDVISDVHDLAKYVQLNYTGFQKIVKKHDKQTGWILRPVFAARLNAKPFFKDNYDAFVVNLSRLYDLVRTRGNPVKGDSAAGGSQQNFVRQTTKYWVHPDNITELKLIILKHLPVLVFNPNKEFAADDSAISSIYYDNDDFDLYLGRLEKSEGAEAHRLRWYGGMDAQTVFVERKTHREDWTGEKSVKARFPIKEKNVNDFLAGKISVDHVFEKMRKEGKKSIDEIENLEALAREIQYTMIAKRLHPLVRSFYHRTAFQLPGDARVRISLDTELTLIREDNHGRSRAGDNWRRMDIGVDWPFKNLPAEDIERFPYAVLEVKLQTQSGQEPPQWIRDVIASHLVEAVPKFSKFLHGTATLFPKDIKILPFWLPQMNVDIKKPVTHRFGIKRLHHGSITNTSEEDDSDTENSIPTTPTLQRRLPIPEPSNGRRRLGVPSAPGNSQDEEERAGDEEDDFFAEDYPLYDSDDDSGLETDDDEDYKWYSPSDNYRVLKRKTRNVGKKLVIIGRYLVPKPVPSVPPGLNVGFNTPTGAGRKRFIAPPGKRIFVPVRIEPKVHFANERTFLSWLEFSIYISTIATTLLNFGDHRTRFASLGFMFLAIATLVYSMGMYIWRHIKMTKRRAVRYHDAWGPTILCVLMLICVGINFGLKSVKGGKGVIPLPGKGGAGPGPTSTPVIANVGNGYGRWSGIN